MKKVFFYHALSAFLAGGIALSSISCTDGDFSDHTREGDKEAIIKFEVNDAQDEALSHEGGVTRGVITSGLSDKDLESKKLEAQSSDNLDVCFIETTIEGVNPIKIDPSTRANITKISTFDDFSSMGLRGTATGINIKEVWFSGEKTKKTGELYTKIPWSWSKPHGRFFAVYPDVNKHQNLIKLNQPDPVSRKASVEFTVDKDVTKQVDLMTACSGDILYATRGQAPKTSLNFRHALTAIRFAVGQNLSFNKTIKHIKIKNAFLHAKYILSDQLNGKGNWDINSYKNRNDVTLDNLNYNTTENPNSIVRNRSKYPNSNERDILNLEDNYTFYMIPQKLDGKDVKVEVMFTDGTDITVTLTGEWKEGTTRTYKLSQKSSNWQYELLVDGTTTVEYDVTNTNYKITSYRKVGSSTMPVSWKIVGYSEDNGATWTTTKPSWLRGLSKESGEGGTAAEQGTSTLSKEVVDLVSKRDKDMQNAPALGSAAKPYNLSNSTGDHPVENTANCYVISAPGHYCIPLVYGNAIKNGSTNTSAYLSSHGASQINIDRHHKTTDILTPLVDHSGKSVTNPWIELTNNKANNNVNGAQIVWADEANLINLAANPFYQVGGNKYLKFEVTKANIKSGNVVVAVKMGNTIVWSWHLWFAPKTALDKIPVTNKQNKTYNFTSEPLGWKPANWKGTPYSTPRSVKIKVEQTIANNGAKKYAEFTITQNPAHTERRGSATHYQWGRKDPFPSGTPVVATLFKKNAGTQIYMQAIIQNPGHFYVTEGGGASIPSTSYLSRYYNFYNLWSTSNKTTSLNDNTVTKTIYDPSPVGYCVPPSNAFTGFTQNGQNLGVKMVDGTDVEAKYNAQTGHLFWISAQKQASIYFPATGYRSNVQGDIADLHVSANCWTAIPSDINSGRALAFVRDAVYPVYTSARTAGMAVRPVSE